MIATILSKSPTPKYIVNFYFLSMMNVYAHVSMHVRVCILL